MVWVGVDIGGTFTDAVVYDEVEGTVMTAKTPSSPDAPSRAVMQVLADLSVPLGEVSRFRHGATVATNAALERSGARLGVVTTSGFRDVLIVGRGNRTQLYDIKAVREPGLVPRSRIVEVSERLDANGEIVVPLDEASVEAAAAALAAMEVEAIAVCFLNSYANPVHEHRAAELLAASLQIPVSCSSQVLAQHREYERFATTALNAYVAPRMADYLGRLANDLRASGVEATPEIMSSSGGSWPFDRMARLAVNSMLSGPAGGVIGAVSFGASLGASNLITYDMGGTSTDVALVRDGHYALAMEGSVGGIPNRAPQIEINTVGAGGGSIAYLDDGGFLSVGPRSAGAHPGPACYGRGGVEPTVTDANVVLGRFRPVDPLGAALDVDAAAAEAAVDQLAAELGLSRAQTADGIIRIAVTRMTGAIKEISVMRGIDPRELSLMAYGGAGPLHAVLIARELGMREVIVPPLPGAFSAYGLLVAPPRIDLSRTHLARADADELSSIRRAFLPLERDARTALAEQGYGAGQVRFQRAVDMRFVGQAFELATPLDDDIDDMGGLLDAFHRVYEERYTHADSGAVEIVCLRISAFGETREPELPTLPTLGAPAEASGTRPVDFGAGGHDTPVYQRERLVGEQLVAGPAIVDEAGSTTLLPPGARLRVHPSGALVISPGDAT